MRLHVFHLYEHGIQDTFPIVMQSVHPRSQFACLPVLWSCQEAKMQLKECERKIEWADI